MRDYDNTARFILRLFVGLVFVYAGIGKLFKNTMPPVEKIVTFIPADVMIWVIGLIQLIVGIFLILGLFTRLSAWIGTLFVFLGIVFAAYLTTMNIVPGYFEVMAFWKDLGILGATLFMALEGAAEFSLDKQIE